MKLLSVERQLQLIFVAMAAGLLAVIGFSLYAARAAAAADDARNLANLRLRTLDLTLSAMQDAETGQRGYLITGETPYLRPFEEAVQVIDQRFTRLHDLYQDDAPSQRTIAQMRELADRKLALLREQWATRCWNWRLRAFAAPCASRTFWRGWVATSLPW